MVRVKKLALPPSALKPPDETPDRLQRAIMDQAGNDLHAYYERILAEHVPEHLAAIIGAEPGRLYEPPQKTKH